MRRFTGFVWLWVWALLTACDTAAPAPDIENYWTLGSATDLSAAEEVEQGTLLNVQNGSQVEENARVAQRGIGKLTARIPRTQTSVGGVRLVKHVVRAVVQDGFARTEIEEEFLNESTRVLEGRYVFTLPPGASVSRLALLVGDTWVEGEVVEKKRAKRIFERIVDAIVPRDPALLEWLPGNTVSLKIFPILPGKTRRVILAYNESLPSNAAGIQYRYPLASASPDNAPIDDFSLSLKVYDRRGKAVASSVTLGASSSETKGALEVKIIRSEYVPSEDFVFRYRVSSDKPRTGLFLSSEGTHQEGPLPELSRGAQGANYFALELQATLPEGVEVPRFQALQRVIVVDRSFGQGEPALKRQLSLAKALLADLASDERFAVLLCDSACKSYPEQALRRATPAALKQANQWLKGRAQPRGASDLAGAIAAGARHLVDNQPAQVVYLGDGRASTGALSNSQIIKQLRAQWASNIDLRLLGSGRRVESITLRALAQALGGVYQPLLHYQSQQRHWRELLLALRTPVLRNAQLTFSDAVSEVLPKRLPTLLLGQEFLVVGKLAAATNIQGTLRAQLQGTDYQEKVGWSPKNRTDNNPLIPRLWAELKLASLELALTGEASDAANIRQQVRISKRHQVLSRHTALLVLENERMFADFGVDRRQRIHAPGITPHAPWARELATGSRAPIGAQPRKQAPTSSGDTQGRLSGAHKTRAPRVRMGATTIDGKISTPAIRRIVRQNYGRFRLCYERALTDQPKLRGMVTIRFIINRNGRVSNVSNAGSTLPNSRVVQCVLKVFYSLTFPKPKDGIVLATYQIHLSPGGSIWGQRGSRDGAAPRHEPGNEDWTKRGEVQIEKLQKQLKRNPKSRGAHQRLISILFARGRFEDAAAQSHKLAQADPDNTFAHEALAWAAALSGKAKDAVYEMANRVELQPHDVDTQLRSARAFEALKDSERACSHFRAAALLAPKNTHAVRESERCSAPQAAPYQAQKDRAGWLQVAVHCKNAQANDCPVPIIVTPLGRVVSPWTPASVRATRARVELSHRNRGPYRTLLLGKRTGVEGMVTVTVSGGSHSKAFTYDGGLSTVVESYL